MKNIELEKQSSIRQGAQNDWFTPRGQEFDKSEENSWLLIAAGILVWLVCFFGSAVIEFTKNIQNI